MENEKRHIWFLIAIALVFCAVLIGYNIFFVKEPQVIVIETDISASDSDTPQSLEEGYIVPTAKVNINTASAEQLDEELEGIGPSLAQRIVSYRDANGPFTDIEQIKNVSGIGDKKFEAIKDNITVS